MPEFDGLRELAETFGEKIPFNKLLGLRFTRLDHECCEVRFDNNPDLVGNFIQGILHGGVISSAIDVAGGAMAAVSLMHKNASSEQSELLERLSRLGTIDLRVDFVRPGRGEHFVASAKVLRSGNKVSVVRMELHNEDDVLIALGTGTYLIG